MDAIKLSSKLISFKSISPQSSGSIEYISEVLKKENFSCHILEFGEKKIKNLFAYFKGGSGPNLCFAGHTDVVPAGNLAKWKTNPFKAEIKGGKLFGRGSSDMKTGIASFISATSDFLKEKKIFSGTICFLITSDEEGEAEFGTKSVVEWIIKKKIKIDFCLVGEPTNPKEIGEMVKIGRRGSLNGVVKVKGVQGHVAYPEKAHNPINDIVAVCQSLNEPFDKGSKTFQPSNLEITSIDVGNDITNLIPDEAKIMFNVRFNNNFDSKKITQIIENRIKKLNIEFELSIKISGEPFFNYSEKLADSIINSIKKITNKTPKLSTSGGTSDARFISKICPVLEFGLVGETMHKINENVSINDIKSLQKIYLEFLRNIFKEKVY